MTLSGVSKKKTRKATDALTRVGLAEHMHKNQISFLVVAIARALANDPDILRDEPTGALIQRPVSKSWN